MVPFNPDLILAQLKGKEKKKYPGPKSIPIQPIEFQRKVASSGSRPVTPQFVTITYGTRTMRIPVHNATSTVTDWIDKLGTDIPQTTYRLNLKGYVEFTAANSQINCWR